MDKQNLIELVRQAPPSQTLLSSVQTSSTFFLYLDWIVNLTCRLPTLVKNSVCSFEYNLSIFRSSPQSVADNVAYVDTLSFNLSYTFKAGTSEMLWNCTRFKNSQAFLKLTVSLFVPDQLYLDTTCWFSCKHVMPVTTNPPAVICSPSSFAWSEFISSPPSHMRTVITLCDMTWALLYSCR